MQAGETMTIRDPVKFRGLTADDKLNILCPRWQSGALPAQSDTDYIRVGRDQAFSDNMLQHCNKMLISRGTIFAPPADQQKNVKRSTMKSKHSLLWNKRKGTKTISHIFVTIFSLYAK